MIYEIHSPDRKWSANVSAKHGANVVKLQHNGIDIFIPLLSDEQLKIDPFLHGCPPLLPANRTYAGKFTFEGIDYTLPLNEPKRNAHLHGFLHCSEFSVISHRDNSILLRYTNNGEIYPFKFCFEAEYILKNDGFYQYFRIKNTDNKRMPFTFALHTTFVEPESFSAPLSCCQERDEYFIPTGRYVPLSPQEESYVSGSRSKGLEVVGYFKSCGSIAHIGDIKYTVSDNFDYWILFNGKGKSNFLCVEPQCGAVNGLNIKDGHSVINPGDTAEFYTVISK